MQISTTSPRYKGTLAVDVAEQRSCYGVMGASAVCLSSGIATIVELGAAGPEVLTRMMESRALAIARVL